MENWGRLSHLFVAMFLYNFSRAVVLPAMTDVTVEAVCPGGGGGGGNACSLSIYLTGFQQAISGFGAVMVMPVFGKLSDVYGRKSMLQIPLALAVIPLVILAWDRSTSFFYAYYVFKTLTAIITEGGALCLSYTYLTDSVSEGKRVSAFGVLCGVVAAANVFGSLAARLLSIPRIFQIAAAVSILVVLYVIVFLKETNHDHQSNSFEQPILVADTESDHGTSSESSKKINFIQEIPSPKDVIRLFRSSITFSLLACVSFFDSLGEAAIVAFLPYFLKARFNFKKDQFAGVFLIIYSGATASGMLVLPVLGRFMGEETLLVLGMFTGFLSMLLDSIAWSSWVPYASGLLSVFFALNTPTLKSMVSKHTGPNEQGIAQGCIMGLTAFANLVSPVIFSPLSAVFLSDDAPFHFIGFSMLCAGFNYLIGLFLSIWIKTIPYLSRS